MRACWAVFRGLFLSLLQYRAAAAAGVATQVFWGLIRMAIFTAFYDAAGAGTPMSRDQTVGYIWLGQAFLLLAMLGVDRDLQRLIDSGDVAYEFLRPVNLYAFWFARSVAVRTAPTLLRSVPILVVATWAGWLRWPDGPRLAAWAASLAGAAMLASAISLLMTLSMFWTTCGRGVVRIVLGLSFLLSGMIVPLPLMPNWMQPALAIQPFRGLVDAPSRFFTGQAPPGAIVGVLAHQFGWTAGLVILGRWLLGRAARRLTVQGG